MRKIIIVSIVVLFVTLGVLDLKESKYLTGVSAILLAIVNGLLFIAGG